MAEENAVTIEKIPLKSIQFYGSDTVYTIPTTAAEVGALPAKEDINLQNHKISGVKVTEKPADTDVPNIAYVKGLFNSNRLEAGDKGYFTYNNGVQEWIAPPYKDFAKNESYPNEYRTPEYRTIERWCGHPVYTRAIIQNLTNNEDCITRFHFSGRNSTHAIVDYRAFLMFDKLNDNNNNLHYKRATPAHSVNGALLASDYAGDYGQIIIRHYKENISSDVKNLQGLVIVKYIKEEPNYNMK